MQRGWRALYGVVYAWLAVSLVTLAAAGVTYGVVDVARAEMAAR